MKRLIPLMLMLLNIFPNWGDEIHKDAMTGNIELIEKELKKGVDIDSQDDSGCSSIIYAIENNQEKTVRFLLEKGANPNLKTKMGDTALFFSVINGNANITDLLLSSKVNINEKNSLGETPLMQAVREGYTDLVKNLIKKGAIVSVKDKDRRNSIMRAAFKGYYDIAVLLLEKGADPFAKDIKNKSANDYAIEKGNQDIITLFKDWKENPQKTFNKIKGIRMSAPNGVVEYKLLGAEPNKEISKGKLEVKKIDTEKLKIPVDEGGYAEQRTFKLFEEFIIGHSNYGKKDRDKICGFGMWLKRSDYKVLSWEWYEQERDNVFKKLQGAGSVRVEFRNRNGFYEIAKIYFVGDQIFRARKENLLALLTNPNKEDWYCTIYDGSYIVFN